MCAYISHFFYKECLKIRSLVLYWGGGGETASFSYVELAKCIEKHECW